MRPHILRKKERLFDKIIKDAEERKKQGFFEGAASAYLKAAKLLSQDVYPEHVAACFNNAGLVYCRVKKYSQAEGYLQRALTIREKELGNEHPDTASSLNNLGDFYREIGEYDNAEQYYQQALAIREEISENNHHDIAGFLNNLTNLYAAKGELEYLGRMATLMAHNISQPIAVIRTATSGALSDLNENLFDPATELKPLLENILKQTDRLSQNMNNFRHLARGDSPALSAINLNAVIEDICQLLFTAQYQLDNIDLQKDLIASPIAHANELAIQEMLISLLSNAKAAVKNKPIKQICIRTWQQAKQAGFCVEDNGDAITPENLPKLFTPFLSSKNEDIGLGLYFCRKIAKDLGGSIEYYPAPLGGAGYRITLPTG